MDAEKYACLAVEQIERLRDECYGSIRSPDGKKLEDVYTRALTLMESCPEESKSYRILVDIVSIVEETAEKSGISLPVLVGHEADTKIENSIKRLF